MTQTAHLKEILANR